MKTLEFHRDTTKDRVTVTCATGEVSVYSHCASCKHCTGVRAGKRVLPAPQVELMKKPAGFGMDEEVLNAVMLFNSLVRDGDAIACADDAGSGYVSMFRH